MLFSPRALFSSVHIFHVFTRRGGWSSATSPTTCGPASGGNSGIIHRLHGQTAQQGSPESHPPSLKGHHSLATFVTPALEEEPSIQGSGDDHRGLLPNNRNLVGPSSRGNPYPLELLLGAFCEDHCPRDDMGGPRDSVQPARLNVWNLARQPHDSETAVLVAGVQDGIASTGRNRVDDPGSRSFPFGSRLVTFQGSGDDQGGLLPDEQNLVRPSSCGNPHLLKLLLDAFPEDHGPRDVIGGLGDTMEPTSLDVQNLARQPRDSETAVLVAGI
ncbi:uncharacterized protein [Struthio camelus]|uniref:uncharacterized protein n=1 Tax=Struthio camelus TaxID=8801 RepID=UPI0036042543